MNNKEKFIKYAELLLEWSEKINLVANSTLDNIEQRHIKDSQQLAEILPSGAQILDLGSGAGFPGVVLAVLGWDVICVESIGKKVNFLNELKKQLDLPNLTIFHGRVEDFVKQSRGKDFIITARAFASIIKILDYVYPLKSRLFLLKGREVLTEVEEAQKKYKFDYFLTESKTGDGFIIRIENIKLFHVK